ncbi:MAG: hypothetical protein AB1779_07895, partial [Candidatus Thermoplasmatota archaeon]
MKGKGRVSFAIVALLILLLSAISVAYIGNLKMENSGSKNVNINNIDEIAKEIEDNVNSQAYYIAAKAIEEGAKENEDIEKIDVRFRSALNSYLYSNYENKTYKGYNLSLPSKPLATILIGKNEVKDIVKSEKVYENGEVGISEIPYFYILGLVDINLKNERTSYLKSINIKRELPSSYPYLLNAYSQLKSNSNGSVGEIVRITEYILHTIAQIRVANGEREMEKIISDDDIKIAVNIAIILEEIRLFRNYDGAIAEKIGIGGLLKESIKKEKIDPADLYLLMKKENKLKLSILLSQYLRGLLDYYVFYLRDYLGITKGIKGFFTALDKGINVLWENGSAVVNWWENLKEDWDRKFGVAGIIDNLITDIINSFFEDAIEVIEAENFYNIPICQNDNTSALSSFISEVSERFGFAIDKIKNNKTLLRENIKEKYKEKLLFAFQRLNDFLKIENKPSWVPDWVVNATKWAYEKLSNAIIKSIQIILDGTINFSFFVFSGLIPNILDSLKLFVNSSLNSIIESEKINNIKYIYNHLYGEKFDFNEEYEVRSTILDMSIASSALGIHNTNVAERFGKMKNAIMGLNFKELIDEISPYQTILLYNIKGLYKLKVSSTSLKKDVFSINGIDKIEENINLNLSLKIPIESGWAIDGVDYKQTNTLYGDALEVAKKVGNILLFGLIEVLRNGITFVTKITEITNLFGENFMKYFGKHIAGLLTIVLDSPMRYIENFARTMLSSFAGRVYSTIGERLNKILQWNTTIFGLNFSIKVDVFQRTLTIGIFQKNWFIKLVIEAMYGIYHPWNENERKKFAGIEFGLFIEGGIKFGNYIFSLFVDPLRIKSQALLTIRGTHIVNGKGWGLELQLPYTEIYEQWECSLETLGIGWLKNIHIPSTGLMVDINFGIQIRYYAGIFNWKNIIKNALLAGFYDTLGEIIDNIFNISLSKVIELIKKFLRNLWRRIVQAFNEYVPEVSFFIQALLSTEGSFAGAGFKLAFVIKNPIKVLVKLIPWLIENIKEFIHKIVNSNYTPNYVSFPYSIREELYIRLDILFRAGLPNEIANKIPRSIPNKLIKDSTLASFVAGGKVTFDLRIEFNLPALVSLWKWDWGKWIVSCGLLLPSEFNKNEGGMFYKPTNEIRVGALPAGETSGNSHKDFWLFNAKFFEIGDEMDDEKYSLSVLNWIAEGADNEEDWISERVEESGRSSDIKISCTENEKTITSGRSVSYKISVKNSGNKKEAVVMVVTQPNSDGWYGKLNYNGFWVNPGETKTNYLTVYVDSSKVFTGEEAIFKVKAHSYEDDKLLGEIEIKTIFDVRTNNADNDADNDYLTDEEERRLGTDQNNPDTDGDGIFDGVEVHKYKTSPKDARFTGGAERPPWTDTYWPMAKGWKNLYSPDGPLDKYDKYVEKLTGRNPKAREWEDRSIFIGGHRANSSTIYEKTAEKDFGYDINGDGDLDDPYDFLDNQGNWRADGDTNDSVSVGWWGHCNGVAAAGMNEPEPKHAVTVLGITFEPSDIKGLLAELYNAGNDDEEFVGERYNGPNDDKNDIYPNVFHITILKWLGEDKRIAAMDKDPGEHVWNYAFWKYEMKIEGLEELKNNGGTGKVKVKTDLYFGESSYPTAYKYTLNFKKGIIVSGEWIEGTS